jgi:DNA polymerase-4
MLTANSSGRSIACVLVTHLPVKAEVRRYPELRGKPVVITESYGSKDLVLDSSPQARGLTPGMPLQEAMAQCKEAVLLQADSPHYNDAFDNLVRSLEMRSPLVEKAGMGCAYVGLEGLDLMYGGEARVIASMIQAAPQEFNPRVGVAGGKFPAYVAAATAEGGRATRVPQDVAGFLSGLSVNLLPLSWENKTRLQRFGIYTLGQLADLPIGAVQAQLGTQGRRAWELAGGLDSSPLVAHRSEPTVEESLSFPSPVVTWHPILTALEVLLGRAFARPELGGRYVRSATLESRVFRRPPWVKRFTFKEALSNKERALFALKSRMDSLSLPGPLEDMKLTLAGFTGESGIQTNLFSDVRKQEQLKEMMRQLEVHLGGKPPIYQMKEIEPWSRIPERRQVLVPFDP